jgi:hemoglobin-like flavoprotein
MLTDTEKDALKRSWRLVIPIADTAADLFYKRLFELRPDYRRLFPDDMTAQKHKLLRMLAFVLRAVDWTDEQWRGDVAPDEDLMLVVLALGRRHSKLYQIPDESYGVVGEALLWTLGYGLGDAFTEDVKRAWTELYTSLARTMRMGGAATVEGDSWRGTDMVQRQGEEAMIEQEVAVGIGNGSAHAGEAS